MKRITQLGFSALTLLPFTVFAGSLDSPAPPTDPAGAMYSLEDICNHLETGVIGTPSTFDEPTAAPGPTGCTLNELMSKTPAIDLINAAKPTDVTAGKTYWGLNNDYWGLQTGTSTVVDAEVGDAEAADLKNGKTAWVAGNKVIGTMPTQTLSDTHTNIAAGYYAATTLNTVDMDLVSGNLRNGVNIFGVMGDPKVVNTSSGDAGPGDIKMGKKAWVDGEEMTGVYNPLIAKGNASAEQVLISKTFSNSNASGISGTMPNQGAIIYTPTTTDQPIAMGYHNGAGLVKGDTNLTSDNIKSGVTIFGISGNPNVVDTSAGDANPNDIAKDKKAFVGGQLLIGTGSLVSYPAPVEKIGQSATAQQGVAWPTPRFTDQGDGTVIDKLTGLIWLKKANCIGTDNPTLDSDKTIGDGKVTWQHALTFVTGINSGTYNCGVSQTDWRLPNIKELQSLIDFSQYNPALPDAHPFSGVQSGTYWSTTSYKRINTYAWVINIFDGYMVYNDQSNVSYVWPVRGGE